MICARIRSALDTLFPNRIVLSLTAQIEDLKRERDYFRGRAERLELRLLPDPVARDKKINAGEPVTIGGHKSWRQVQAEHTEALKKAAEEKAQAEIDKAKTSGSEHFVMEDSDGI